MTREGRKLSVIVLNGKKCIEKICYYQIRRWIRIGDSVCSSKVVLVIIDVCGLFIIHNLFGEGDRYCM